LHEPSAAPAFFNGIGHFEKFEGAVGIRLRTFGRDDLNLYAHVANDPVI
jgi:hypothetical protein